jgi:hypothetical protein
LSRVSDEKKNLQSKLQLHCRHAIMKTQATGMFFPWLLALLNDIKEQSYVLCNVKGAKVTTATVADVFADKNVANVNQL